MHSTDPRLNDNGPRVSPIGEMQSHLASLKIKGWIDFLNMFTQRLEDIRGKHIEQILIFHAQPDCR